MLYKFFTRKDKYIYIYRKVELIVTYWNPRNKTHSRNIILIYMDMIDFNEDIPVSYVKPESVGQIATPAIAE